MLEGTAYDPDSGKVNETTQLKKFNYCKSKTLYNTMYYRTPHNNSLAKLS